jgi:hypothetical protein
MRSLLSGKAIRIPAAMLFSPFCALTFTKRLIKNTNMNAVFLMQNVYFGATTLETKGALKIIPSMINDSEVTEVRAVLVIIPV